MKKSILSKFRDSRGFTLIEIISVILIVGIMAAVAVPMFDTAGVDVSASAAAIETDIRFTQELAMARDPQSAAAVKITFTPSGSTYSITDPSGLYTETVSLPDNVIITTGGTISFNKWGEPENGTQSIVINASGEIKTITVEQFTGRVTVS